MLYNSLIAVALAAVLGAVRVSSVEHGELADIAGEQYRWHQIARDVWTGVPADEWNEDVHTRSDVGFDIGHVVDFDKPPSWDVEAEVEAFARDLDELESRQLKEVCEFVTNCFKDTREHWTVQNGLDALVKAIEVARSKDKRNKIWEFLVKKPIMAKFLQGNISLMVNDEGSVGETPDECSAEDDEAGFLRRMLSTALGMLPDAFSASYSFVSNGRKFTVTLNSAPVGKVPVAQPGECTDQSSG